MAITKPAISWRMNLASLWLCLWSVGASASSISASTAPVQTMEAKLVVEPHAEDAGLPWMAFTGVYAKAVQQVKLVASNATSAREGFGNAVALSGDTAIVGAPNMALGAGAAYIYVRSGGGWIEQGRLIPDSCSSCNQAQGFGQSVAISGDTALVGAPGESFAYVFVRTGSVWSRHSKLAASSRNGQFGISVALSGDYALVGAPLESVTNFDQRGAAYVFVRNGATWSQQAKLIVAPDPNPNAAVNHGIAVALSGDTAVVSGARSAYVHVRRGATWSQQAVLSVRSAPRTFDAISVALDGDTALIGSPLFVDDLASLGQVSVFQRTGSTWALQNVLLPTDNRENDFFGISLSLSGDVALVGASRDRGSQNDQGSAYLFARTGIVWRQVSKITAGDPRANAQFGGAVALSGDTALIGEGSVYLSSTGAGDDAAYVFSLPASSGPIAAQAIASEIGACQSAPPGGSFTQPLGIIARTASGAPAPGVPITFSVAPFNGASATLSATSVSTDTLGRARVTAVANGTAGGPYAVTARLPDGASTTFKLVNLVSGGPRPACDAVPVSGLAPTAAQPLTFSFRVDAGTPSLRVVTSGGTGNANLRVQLAQALNTDSKQMSSKSTLCESTGPANEEECTIANPTPGSWTAVVSSPSSASNVTACMKCGPIPPPELVRLEKDQSLQLLPSIGINEARRFFVTVPEGARDVVVRTAGGAGNADLLTRFGEPPMGLRIDCLQAGPNNNEACDLGNGSGTLYIEVRAAPSFLGLTLTATWTEPGAAPQPAVEHDFNRDGFGDLLWRNDAAGRSYAQLRSPNGVLNEGDLFVSSDWRVTHAADINGDGRADTLWYNAQTAESYYWVSDVSGLRPASQGTLLRDPAWRITHTGDFNGDRIDDLLWYRSDTGETHVWLMQVAADGRPFAPTGFRRTVLTSREWNVVATGDIDSDGIHDLIWYNAVTGESYYWHMGGLLPQRQGSLLTDRNWFVVAAGDLDGDGRSELLWYNPILRNNYYWAMNQAGTGPASQGTLLIHPEWRITGTTDVDGDRRDDLIWRNDATGESYLWYMNGPVPVRQQSLLVNSAWRVINR